MDALYGSPDAAGCLTGPGSAVVVDVVARLEMTGGPRLLELCS
jgi:hypothetical protein